MLSLAVLQKHPQKNVALDTVLPTVPSQSFNFHPLLLRELSVPLEFNGLRLGVEVVAADRRRAEFGVVLEEEAPGVQSSSSSSSSSPSSSSSSSSLASSSTASSETAPVEVEDRDGSNAPPMFPNPADGVAGSLVPSSMKTRRRPRPRPRPATDLEGVVGS